MAKGRLVAAFEEFDANNPKIWDYFVRFAFQAIDAGRKKLAVSFLIERIRWEVMILTKSRDEFKINNNHRAYYARKWKKLYPLYESFFNTRKVRSEPDEDDGQQDLGW